MAVVIYSVAMAVEVVFHGNDSVYAIVKLVVVG